MHETRRLKGVVIFYETLSNCFRKTESKNMNVEFTTIKILMSKGSTVQPEFKMAKRI